MNWIFWLIAFFLGFLSALALGWIYILALLKKEKKTYLKEMKETVRFWYLKPFPIVNILKIHKDQHREKIKALKSALRDANSKLKEYSQMIGRLQSRLDESERKNRIVKVIPGDRRNFQERPFSKTDNPSGDKKPLIPDPVRKVTTLYFSIPEADGSFHLEKGEPFQDDKKFYKIINSRNSNQGDLYYISGLYDQKAIENIDYYLIPVCEVENISERDSAAKVFQKEAGTVVKISGKWITNKKIKIKLI